MSIRRHRPGEATPSGERVSAAAPRPKEASSRPRLAERLSRTRQAVAAPFGRIGVGRIDEATFDELAETLLSADVGLKSTGRILDALREKVRAGAVGAFPGALITALRAEIVAGFAGEDRALKRNEEPPSVWLFVGVNGVGKTTTIGKLAAQEVAEGRSVVVAAGDTFRAAA
ncbi:MAG: signal recognition particle receptor subunit alpha, partial [Acidimicrobiales bacterium]